MKYFGILSDWTGLGIKDFIDNATPQKGGGYVAAYRTEKQRIAQEEREADEQIRTAVRVVLAVHRLTMERLAAMLGISRATLYTRMQNPTAFTVGEIRTLKRIGGEYIDL